MDNKLKSCPHCKSVFHIAPFKRHHDAGWFARLLTGCPKGAHFHVTCHHCWGRWISQPEEL